MKKRSELEMRMKAYESVPKNFLMLRGPKIIRLDMRAGHTFTANLEAPFDDIFSQSMISATKVLCKEIPGVMMAYTESDEISLVINDVTKRNETNCFFDGNVEKICSISASICTLAFNKEFMGLVAAMKKKEAERYLPKVMTAQFDSRCFNLPNIQEVHNYLLWREQDASRNSISMVARSKFPQKEVQDKSSSQLQDMLFKEFDINWNDYPCKYKRGCAILKEEYIKDVEVNGKVIPNVKRKRWEMFDIPLLTKDPNFVPIVYNGAIMRNGELVPLD